MDIEDAQSGKRVVILRGDFRFGDVGLLFYRSLTYKELIVDFPDGDDFVFPPENVEYYYEIIEFP